MKLDESVFRRVVKLTSDSNYHGWLAKVTEIANFVLLWVEMFKTCIFASEIFHEIFKYFYVPFKRFENLSTNLG